MNTITLLECLSGRHPVIVYKLYKFLRTQIISLQTSGKRQCMFMDVEEMPFC